MLVVLLISTLYILYYINSCNDSNFQFLRLLFGIFPFYCSMIRMLICSIAKLSVFTFLYNILSIIFNLKTFQLWNMFRFTAKLPHWMVSTSLSYIFFDYMHFHIPIEKCSFLILINEKIFKRTLYPCACKFIYIEKERVRVRC